MAITRRARVPPLVEIPGYRIQREIGRGGSSRVYLALQHTFGSPVAIKVPSEEALRSTARREAFLAEGALARKLDHPNIVRILDVGESGGVPYLVMEYIRGGDLNHNLRAGLHMQNVLAVVKDVAAALGYAHGRGIVHGDIKPENILVNEQGVSLLSDFGIASPDPATTTAVVRGTPGYMSPEQLAGRMIDGRTDIYSLGIVFYLMLTGRLPFDPDDLGGTGARARRPALPLQLAAFEEAIQRMLARSPEDRFASALDIAPALDAIRADGLVPNAVVKTEAVSTAEIASLAVRNEGPGSGTDARGSSRFRRLGAAATLLGVLLLVCAALYAVKESPRVQRTLAAIGLVENPDLVVAWQAAEEARRNPNESPRTVVDGYRRVLAIDPSRADAQAVIDEYARQWKEDIGRLIDLGDLDTARDKLEDLAVTFPDDPEFTVLSDQLKDRGEAAELVEQSIRLLQSSGLDDKRAVDSAVVRLKEALTRHPGNQDATQWLNRVAIHYADLARQQAGSGDGPAALEAMERAERANPTFEGVEDVRNAVAAAVGEHDAAQARIREMLQQAAALRESGDLVEAIKMYRSVRVIAPEAAVALQGFAGTSSDIVAQFVALLDDDRLDDATSLFEAARQAGIADDADEQMRELRDATLKRIDDVGRLNDEAEWFMQQGYVTGPDPENNAVARVREALRLDADNADAIRLQSWAATRLAEVAVEAYNAGMVEEGLEYLEVALAVTPGIDRWQVQREQWRLEILRIRAAAPDSESG